MARKSAPGPCRFVIETQYQGNKGLVFWELDQRVSNVYDQRSWDRLYNQVQEHLSDLSNRTGFDYLIRYWGSPEGALAHKMQYNIITH